MIEVNHSTLPLTHARDFTRKSSRWPGRHRQHARRVRSPDFSFTKFIACGRRSLLSLWNDAQLFLFVIYQRIGWNTLDKKNVPPDRRSCADNGFAPENRRPWVDRYIVLDGWVAFSTFLDFAVLVLLKATRAECDRVIKLNACPDLRRLADDHTGAVVDKKMRPNLRARVDVDAGAAVCPFSHDARDQWHLVVKQMRHSMDRDRFQGRIRQNNFFVARGSRIAFVGGVDIRPKKTPH